MSTQLPKPPRVEMLITVDAQGKPTVNQGVLRDIRIFLESLFKVLSQQAEGVTWSGIDFSGSNLADIVTRAHSDLQGVSGLNTESTSQEKDKHVSNLQGKIWEDHRALTVTAHGGIVAYDDSRLTDARTPTVHDNTYHTTPYQATSEKDADGGYAGLNADGRTTKGAIATDDFIITDTTKGLVLKDAQSPPHYWRVTISDLGALVITDLGTTAP